ncbi:MAG: Asp-tRNA(Asn)/Glu-tRNA(Gln) amidotransferase subunit GatC [Patescibacteria group bacterium]
MLSSSKVQHIAKLARLELSDKEIVKFQKELTSIWEYFEVLSELDVSKVEPMTHAVPLQNVSRQDIAKPKSSEEAQRLLKMAPETKDGYLKVKSILQPTNYA